MLLLAFEGISTGEVIVNLFGLGVVVVQVNHQVLDLARNSELTGSELTILGILDATDFNGILQTHGELGPDIEFNDVLLAVCPCTGSGLDDNSLAVIGERHGHRNIRHVGRLAVSIRSRLSTNALHLDVLGGHGVLLKHFGEAQLEFALHVHIGEVAGKEHRFQSSQLGSNGVQFLQHALTFRNAVDGCDFVDLCAIHNEAFGLDVDLGVRSQLLEAIVTEGVRLAVDFVRVNFGVFILGINIHVLGRLPVAGFSIDIEELALHIYAQFVHHDLGVKVMHTSHVVQDTIRDGIVETLHGVVFVLEVPVDTVTNFDILPNTGTGRVRILGLVRGTVIDRHILQRKHGVGVHHHEGHSGLVLDFVVGIGNRGVATSSEQHGGRGESQEFMFHTFSL